MSGYEEMAEEWNKRLRKAIEHIEEARQLIGQIPPNVLTAISTWEKEGFVNKEGKKVSLDVTSHAGFRAKCLVIYRLLGAILAELDEGRII